MTSKHIPATLVRAVRKRAGFSCEYCQLPQEYQEAIFHIDHVSPRSAGGKTVLDNLAVACVTCSLRKGDRVEAEDQLTSAKYPLFHPRTDVWSDHFAWGKEWRLIGLTARGRATVVALGMNRPRILATRQLLASVGHFPPKG
jgi:5-methylcytosine-specific restriction endonuclease McrA